MPEHVPLFVRISATDWVADLVFIAREMLREPCWALKAEQELGTEPAWPIPHGYAVKRRAK
jgi:2,4-dienoyl-CoA reductase-like NADH-dependent reductase (Old Yellow Enzyme family)